MYNSDYAMSHAGLTANESPSDPLFENNPANDFDSFDFVGNELFDFDVNDPMFDFMDEIGVITPGSSGKCLPKL